MATELVSLWSKHLAAALATRGFQQVAEIHEPGGDGVIEYRRNGHFLSLQVRPERAGRHDIVLEADAPEWAAVITMAAQEAARETVSTLAAGLTTGETSELPAGLARVVREAIDRPGSVDAPPERRRA